MELANLNYNLDQSHPSEREEVEREPPSVVLRRILEKEDTILGLFKTLEDALSRK
jgi:hypothetical protein